MTRTLAQQLAELPKDVTDLLVHHHFDQAHFLSLASRLSGPAGSNQIGNNQVGSNQVVGEVLPPAATDVKDLPLKGSAEGARLAALGDAALRAGQCALVVLAGGMATRMGGVVKALVEALPGKTFLDLRLAEIQTLSRRVKRPIPLWLMTSHATDEAIKHSLREANLGQVAAFPQRLSPRLKQDGTLFLDAQGLVSLHAPGHGDLPDALRDSGLLKNFVSNGGRYLTVTNLDNLGAGLDPVVLGFHIAHGKPVTCEVVDKERGDRGGIPVRFQGKMQVLEEFRLPSGFDAETVRVFNTNTFHFDAQALLDTPLDWTYFTVEKNVDGQRVVQFERLVNELTAKLPTQFLRVPRTGPEGRFLPVKDHNELAQRRPEIELIAAHRGMLS